MQRPLQFKVVKGHVGETILASTVGKDKVQIMAVAPSSCPAGKTPIGVCNSVLEQLPKDLTVAGDLRGSEEAKDLKKIASDLKFLELKAPLAGQSTP